MATDVPVIDIGKLPHDPACVAAIARAFEQWGFFHVVNHGIDVDLREQFMAAMRTFFRLPAADKQSLIRSHENPMGFYDRELTKNTPDWKQVFDYGIDYRDPGSTMTSRWPVLPGFQQVMVAWFEACERVSFTLLDALEQSLGDNNGVMSQGFVPVHTSFVRLNYYPPCPEPASLGVNRHTDAGALTVLVQDDVPSLQVQRDNVWHTIFPVPDGLIINAGDMLQVWSNDRFKAPEHRVLARTDTERFSAPFFFNPDFHTTCTPLVGNGNEARYHPVNWGHFRTERANGDYADFGEEIQIAQFRR